MERVCDK